MSEFNASSGLIKGGLEAGFLIPTTMTPLLEIYEIRMEGVVDVVKFFIFFPPEPEEEVPSWYPTDDNLQHDAIYVVINEENAGLGELFGVVGVDDLKKIAIKHIWDFVYE